MDLPTRGERTPHHCFPCKIILNKDYRITTLHVLQLNSILRVGTDYDYINATLSICYLLC